MTGLKARYQHRRLTGLTGYEQASRCLGIEDDFFQGEVLSFKGHLVFQKIAVPLSSCREDEVSGSPVGFLKVRQTGRIDAGRAGTVKHFMKMAAEAESRHIGTAVHTGGIADDIHGIGIERTHTVYGLLETFFTDFTGTVSNGQDTDSQGLGENEMIAGHTGIVAQDTVRMDGTIHSQAVFHRPVVNGMAPPTGVRQLP